MSLSVIDVRYLLLFSQLDGTGSLFFLLKNNKIGFNAKYYSRVKRFCESDDLLGRSSCQPKSELEDDRYAGGESRVVESGQSCGLQ